MGDDADRSDSLPVTEILTENCESREGQAIDMIVLHHTGSTADARQIARFFQRPEAQASVHYIIDRDGSLIRSVEDGMRAWHAGNACFEGDVNINQRSIGIELCNIGDKSEAFPREQITSLIILMARLSAAYDIPSSRFTRHRDVAVPYGRKVDTADNLAVDVIYRSVEVLRDTGVLFIPDYDRTERNIPGKSPRVYEVREGDSWEYISWLIYDTPGLADALEEANPGSSLVPGEILRVPDDPYP